MPSQQQRDEGDTGSARRGPNPLACEIFQGINTATTRSGVPDQQMFWCDGFIPLSPRNLRVLPGIGDPLYTSDDGSVVCFYFYNIESTPYMVVFLSNGSAVQVRTADGATTTILSVGTIPDPRIGEMGIAQYGSQYLIIVANSGNGYWVWDGSVLYTAGTLGPGITLTNSGSAYVSTPTVSFSGGSGSGATADAVIGGGVVTNVIITNPGSGYMAGDVVTVNFSGGTSAGSGASLTAVLTSAGAGGSGATATISWSGSGSNFTPNSTATVTASGSGYVTATGTWVYASGTSTSNWSRGTAPGISITLSGGAVVGVTLTGGHFEFNATFANLPTISITDTSGGTYSVTSVTGTPTGSGYSPSTSIIATAGGSPIRQATITPVIVGGVITGVNISDGGQYGSNTPPDLTVDDTATDAQATAMLMPFGVQGTCVETYAGHVWVANGPLVQFTAPGSVADFSTANGGGSFTSSDSFLRVGYTRLVQTNGFLFLIGDSSMNYISSVMTTTPEGGSPTTTFTNNNADPETGTPYPASVTTIGQDLFVANENGVYISTGGTFEKKSEPLDGVYNTASFVGVQFSAAKDLIFGKLVWMVLVPVIDPVTKTQRNKLFMFNQKYWWSSEQDVALTFVQGQELYSVFQSYGTDGTKVYPLFTTPSTAFTKRFQSRLWDAPAGYDHVKADVNLFAIAQFLGSANLTYNVYIDNEGGISNRAGPYAHSGTTADAEVFSVMPPTAIAQNGVLTGMTVETTADDLVIVSVMMQPEIVQYRA